ncbi:MAG: TonB-dependent receptor [Stygiobacter sp.]
MKKVKQLLTLLFAVMMFSFGTMYSQTTTASINGLVVDQNGNPLPGANVVAVHLPSGSQYGTTTRNDGRYNILGMRVGGPYKVTVSFVGYTSQVEEGFELSLGQNLRINFKLPEEAVQLSGITVTAEKNAILSQSRTGAAQNISIKQIEEIPTISRSFQSFAKLSPMFSGTGLSAAGRSNRYNNIQLDGTQYNDLFGLGSTGTPGGQTSTNPVSLDAVREFQVVIAPFDVRLGGFTGGGINAITRSGTNEFLGSAYFFGRNQSLVGKYGTTDELPKPGSTDIQRKAVADFKDYQYGFRFGGPIMKDKLFFFVNGEMTQNQLPLKNASLSQGDPTVIAGFMDKVNKVANIFKTKYGYDPGSYDEFLREQPSSKLFLRFDYNLSENHKLTFRHNFVDAYTDVLGSRTATNAMSFTSYNYRIKSKTNSAVLQLNSTFSNQMNNELILGYTWIRDRRHGTTQDAPEVRINDGGYSIWAGPDQFSSANELDQDIFEVTDNLNYFAGDHVFTVGTHNEFYSFRNLFLRAYFGSYIFNSITDFENGKPGFYLRRYSIYPKGNPNPLQAAEFDVAQYGFYVQDEWTVSPALKLTLGVRGDIPTFPTEPALNDSVSKYFSGISTLDKPKTTVLFSPRFGFNYDMSGDRSTQLRGGIGIFTGRVPYVWMSNNYGNTGVYYAEVRNGGTVPNGFFKIDPYNQPKPGDPGTGSARTQAEINLVDPDTKMPQVLRFNVAIDQQLPYNTIGTIEYQYSKSINDMIYRKLNIGKPIGKIGQLGSGIDGRTIYGGTTSYNNNFFDVLQLANTSSGYQSNLAFQLQRNMAKGLSFNIGYVTGVAKDRNSVLSSQAVSQMRFNQIPEDPNNPPLTTANFQIDHRMFAQVSYVVDFFDNASTTFSLYFNRQSGDPLTYYVTGDLNNDGFDNNDLFYIPRNESEILLGSIVNNQYVKATASGTTWDDLNNFINNDDYLRENRGKIAERNAARQPWVNYLDFRFSQDIPDFMGIGKFQLTLDILNVLNLLNSEWGWVETVPNNNYAIVTYRGRITYNGKANIPVYSFSKPARNVPWSISDSSSRWAMQLGIRYSFGF